MGRKPSNNPKSKPKVTKNVISKVEPKSAGKKQVLDKFDEQIINFYHSNTALWNTSDPKYKDNVFKGLLIEKLSKNLNLESK